MEEELIKIIAEYQGLDPETIKTNTNLITEVNISSFDMIGIVCKVEEKFNIEIPDRKIREFQTVKDVVEYIEKSKKVEE